mgnify:CR=1 FL=1
MAFEHKTETEARQQILDMVAEYCDTYHNKKGPFQEGDRIPYASRVYDHKEMVNLVDSSLEFWLTSGRYTDEFEKKLADYLGVPVLNLSMGPVHARETGPTAPGQWVLRAGMSCVGCWQCGRGRLYCKGAFSPAAVADTVLALLQTPCLGLPAALPSRPGLRLWRTGRDVLGLHSLSAVGSTSPSCRPVLEDFWQAVFLYIYQPALAPLLQTRLTALHTRFPALQTRLGAALAQVCAHCAAALRNDARSLPPGFWNSQPPLARLGSGFLHLYLQNASYSRRAWRTALERLADLASRLG